MLVSSIGKMSKVAIVIKNEKKVRALAGRLILNRGNVIMICWQLIKLHRKFKEVDKSMLMTKLLMTTVFNPYSM